MKKPGLTILSLFLLLTALPAAAQEKTAVVEFPGGQRYRCEVADTYMTRAIGLKNHESLPPCTGMLFVYPKPSYTSFWMPPEMKFPLDLVFLDQERCIVHLAENAQPCEASNYLDCETYSPEIAVSFVIEIPAGDIKKLDLEIGDRVSIVGTNESEKGK